MAITKSIIPSPPVEGGAFDPGPVVAALASVVGGPAALHESEIAGREWDYVKACLDSGWVSSAGAYVDRFEAMLADVTGVAHAVATVNGTAALHAALVLADVEAGDEVMVPALTFVATANAVAYLGARPHLADSEEKTLGLDAAKLAHYLERITEFKGRPVASTPGPVARFAPSSACTPSAIRWTLDALTEVCQRFGLVLIEDAAESLGSTYKGASHRRLGAAFGPQLQRQQDGDHRRRRGDLDQRRRPGPGRPPPDHHRQAAPRLGIRSRPGRVQLPHAPTSTPPSDAPSWSAWTTLWERKRRLARAYAAALDGIAGVRVFTEPDFARSNYWLNLLLLERAAAHCRDELLAQCHARGLEARPAWTPMHQLAMYAEDPRMDLTVSEDIHARLINLPSSPRLAASVA